MLVLFEGCYFVTHQDLRGLHQPGRVHIHAMRWHTQRAGSTHIQGNLTSFVVCYVVEVCYVVALTVT
jgi:hypothetical protein